MMTSQNEGGTTKLGGGALVQDGTGTPQAVGEHGPSTNKPKTINLLNQIFLSAACLGSEVCITFENIYIIMTLRFLGVPLSLVSVNGLVSGFASMVLVPFLGYWTDRGTNPRIRKLSTLLLGVGIYMIGISLIVTATLSRTDNPKGASLHTTNASSAVEDTPHIPNDGTNMSSTYTPAFDDSVYLSISGGLGIIGFAFLDIGFDFSMSVTRAFILEVVPTIQHTSVLVVATTLSALGGILISALGLFDISGVLGPLFHVDGMAATLLVICLVLVVITCVTFGASIAGGYFLHKQKRKDELNAHLDSMTPRHLWDDEITGKSNEIAYSTSKDEQANFKYTDEYGSMTESQYMRCYGSCHGSQTNLSFSKPSGPLDEENNLVHATFEQDYLESDNFKYNLHDNQTGKYSDLFADNPNFDNQGSFVGSLTYYTHSLSESLMVPDTTNHRSNILKKKIAQLSNNKFNTKQNKMNHINNSNLKTALLEDHKPSFFNKKVILLAVAVWSSFGNLLVLALYLPNTLTTEVLGGDPTAPIDSEAYANYVLGQRLTSSGNLLYYCVYFVMSLCNKKILEYVGPYAQFVFSQCLVASLGVIFLVTQTQDAFMVLMVALGIHKCMAYTVHFVLATKVSRAMSGSSEDCATMDSLGQIMSVVGFCVPVQFVTMGLTMGPLMEVLGTTWVPVYYSLVLSVVAVVTMAALYREMKMK